MWWFIGCVLNCLGYGNVERVLSQWICFPGAWGNPSLAVVSLSQKVIGLTPRKVKNKESHQSQWEKLSLPGQWEGEHSCRCCQRARPGCGMKKKDGQQAGLAAEKQLVRRLGLENRPPLSVSSRRAARLTVIMGFARNKHSASYGKTDMTLSAKDIYCVFIMCEYERNPELISLGWPLPLFLASVSCGDFAHNSYLIR